MADPSASRDWYFRPARNAISETKRNHMGQGLGNTGGEAKQLLFLSSKTRNYCGGMSWGIVM